MPSLPQCEIGESGREDRAVCEVGPPCVRVFTGERRFTDTHYVTSTVSLKGVPSGEIGQAVSWTGSARHHCLVSTTSPLSRLTALAQAWAGPGVNAVLPWAVTLTGISMGAPVQLM